jgi:hypothetical protein
MSTPIHNRAKAITQISEIVGNQAAHELFSMPKRALILALLDLAPLHNDSSCDDTKATGAAAIRLAQSFK